MLASLLIAFREAMEAGLIVGIVLAASAGIPLRGRWVGAGVAAGVAGACVVAAFAGALSQMLQGAGQEAFTAAILGFAVLMLGWHIVWMSHHGRTMTRDLRAVGDAVRQGRKSLFALAAVVAVAVMREGSELVLFLYGLVAASHTGTAALAAGGVLGLALAAGVSWLLYRGLLAVPVGRLFSVTNGLVALLAAGMAGQAAALLQSGDLIPAWGDQVWDTSWLLGDGTLVGRSLHALVGYAARPSGVQVAAWAATLAVLAGLSWLVGQKRPRALAAAAVCAWVLAFGGAARADDLPVLVFKNHRFEPNTITVPAHLKFKLQVRNDDSTADEFESVELNREKLVPPGQTITVFLGPLQPGRYRFFGDFHQDTAQGVMVAQ